MYISCIQFIKTVKKGGSFENYSPTLASICNVPNWKKVASGLVKMYIDELFKKWVIMQHFYFGSVIRFE
jgi:serine/threonine-protein phosphatase 2A activator